MKKIIVIGTILILALSGLLAVRFIFGGDEDTWICAKGKWVKHGNPHSPMPQKNCSR